VISHRENKMKFRKQKFQYLQKKVVVYGFLDDIGLYPLVELVIKSSENVEYSFDVNNPKASYKYYYLLRQPVIAFGTLYCYTNIGNLTVFKTIFTNGLTNYELYLYDPIIKKWDQHKEKAPSNMIMEYSKYVTNKDMNELNPSN
jgi:hypothetical protein